MEFFGVGLPELIVILVLILIVVGPTRLPEMAVRLARFIRTARSYASAVTSEFTETLQELEKDYDEIKGEWKEIGEGLDETARAVGEELKAADHDAHEALDEAKTAAEGPSKPTPPAP